MNLKNLFGISCILLLSTGNLFSQKSPIKFGKISEDEQKMTVYENDTSAAAVVIADYGVAEIVYTTSVGFQLQYSRHKRIKILKNEGLDQANVVIRLYRGAAGVDENLSGLKASTYNLEDGKLEETKFSKKDLLKEEESRNWTLRKFAFPNVKVGSIIEFDYAYISPYFLSLQDWYFQDLIPVMWSEFRTTIPEYFEFRQSTGGYLMASINEDKSTFTTLPGTSFTYTNNYRRIVFQDVPAFKDEEYITTARDYLARIEYELRSIKMPNSMVQNYSTSWDEIGKKLMEDENFGRALNRHGIVKELTEQINSSDSIEQKILAAFALVKKHMKWDETYRIYTDNTLRAAFNKNKGNMAEINLLLVNLLRSVGVEAHPVLFSARSHGMIKQFYPMISAFNGVLASARVNGKDILMDATSAFIKPGEIPAAYINGNGLKVMDNKVEWVPLLNSEQMLTSSVVSLSISEGQLKAVIIKNSNSSSAASLRGRIARAGKEQFIEDFKKKNANWEIASYTIENEDNMLKPVTEKIEIDNFNQIDASGDIIYLPAIVTSEIDENPFASENRMFPVDFAVPISERNVLNLIVPEGYEVEELPASIVYALPENAAQFVYKSQVNGSVIQIYSQLKINKTFYRPQEYQLLKEFFKNLIAKHGEQIVLKKV